MPSSNAKTHEKFVEEMKEKLPYAEILGEYINNYTRIQYKCLIHDEICFGIPSVMVKGVMSGCKKCTSKSLADYRIITNEEFLKRLSECNPNITPMEEYKGIHEKIKFKCNDCGYIWDATPATIYRTKTNKCIVCKKELKRPIEHDDFIKVMYEVNKNMEILEEYNPIKHRIKCKCKIHDYETTMEINKLLNGHGCTFCGQEKRANSRRKTEQEFYNMLKLYNVRFIPIEKYKNFSKKIKFKCDKCGFIFESSPSLIRTRKFCPSCEKDNTSNLEYDIQIFLSEHNIKFIKQHTFEDCKHIHKLRFDFYLKEYNLCIEADGQQHFKPVEYFKGEEGFKKRQKNDQIKNKYCEDNNIKLIRIPYWHKENISEILTKELLNDNQQPS